MEIAPIDVVFSIIIILAAIRCAFRGFISEIMAVAAIIGGIGGAILFSGLGATALEQYFGESPWNQVIAFLVIFISVYLVVKLLEGFMERLLDRLHLDRLDRSLGLFLGIAEGIVVVVVIVFLLMIQPFFNVEKLMNDSFVVSLVLRVVPFAEISNVNALKVPDV